MRYPIVFFALLFQACTALAVGCPAAPEGLPGIAGTEIVCHAGYASLLDPTRKESLLVTYRLTAEHAVNGCGSRKGLSFRPDRLAPAEDQGRPVDYHRSGYDLGHLAPNGDFAWDAGEQRDTFSMANVAPQLHELNADGWERGEEFTRAWASGRGGLDVFVGPIFDSRLDTIGPDRLPVPAAFFKVLVDRQAGEVLAFEMKQEAIDKMDDLTPWVVPVERIERDAGLTLPIPAGLRTATSAWAVDMPSWRKAHAAACSAQ